MPHFGRTLGLKAVQVPSNVFQKFHSMIPLKRFMECSIECSIECAFVCLAATADSAVLFRQGDSWPAAGSWQGGP